MVALFDCSLPNDDRRFRWLGAAPRRLEWWAALSYLIGLILYYIGVVAIIINDCPHTPLSTLSYVRSLASPVSCLGG